MDIYKLPIFKEMEREYKLDFGIDIMDLIKPKALEIDFKGFEERHLTTK
nr:hypothetical protein [Borrelia parkeri]